MALNTWGLSTSYLTPCKVKMERAKYKVYHLQSVFKYLIDSSF